MGHPSSVGCRLHSCGRSQDPDVHRRVQLLVLRARRVLGRTRQGYAGSHPPAVQHGPGDGRQDRRARARAARRTVVSAFRAVTIIFWGIVTYRLSVALHTQVHSIAEHSTWEAEQLKMEK